MPVRNALTKMSHIHFTSTEAARERVIAMGEEPWRVHRAGAPSLDHLRRSQLFSREEVEAACGLDFRIPAMLVAYHPVTLERDTTCEADALFAALEEIAGQGTMQILFCYPNADAGSRSLLARTRTFLERHPSGKLFVNLDAVTYWSLLRCANVMLGNSSSGHYGDCILRLAHRQRWLSAEGPRARPQRPRRGAERRLHPQVHR